MYMPVYSTVIDLFFFAFRQSGSGAVVRHSATNFQRKHFVRQCAPIISKEDRVEKAATFTLCLHFVILASTSI